VAEKSTKGTGKRKREADDEAGGGKKGVEQRRGQVE